MQRSVSPGSTHQTSSSHSSTSLPQGPSHIQNGHNICEFIDPSTIVEINKVLYSEKPATNNLWSLKAEKMKLEHEKSKLLVECDLRNSKHS
mmetsp:Transcript_31163/g.58002  ORF Transcript_31163/g.58002 Transcript_31163/m.58002 type:complete len:91 (-) Transcript_31163:345-617(-)